MFSKYINVHIFLVHVHFFQTNGVLSQKRSLEDQGHNQLNSTSQNVEMNSKSMFMFTILSRVGKGRDHLSEEKIHQISDYRNENLGCFSISALVFYFHQRLQRQSFHVHFYDSFTYLKVH